MSDSCYPPRWELEECAEKWVKSKTREELIELLDKAGVLPKQYPVGQAICQHLNTEETHPYGWLACLDCGKLLIDS